MTPGISSPTAAVRSVKQRRLLAVPGPFAYHKTILVNKWWGKTIRKNRFLQYCSLCRKHWTKQPFDESCSWRQRSAFILFQVVSTFKWFCFKSVFSMNVHFFLLNVHIYMNVLYIDVYICIFFLLVIYILPSSGVWFLNHSNVQLQHLLISNWLNLDSCLQPTLGSSASVSGSCQSGLTLQLALLLDSLTHTQQVKHMLH